MKKRLSSTQVALSLVELLVVVGIIVVLASIVIGIYGAAQKKSSQSQAKTEIQMLSTAAENYFTENQIYPRHFPPNQAESFTDKLDPRVHGDPTKDDYKKANRFFYRELTGDKLPAEPKFPDTYPEAGERIYLKEINNRLLKGPKTTAGRVTEVEYIQDPYSNPYGYSSARAMQEEEFKKAVREDPAKAVRKKGKDVKGYNETFDLWSTAGSTATPRPGEPGSVDLKWIKNW
jgi:type II secretory pathway pseudopilin PulG